MSEAGKRYRPAEFCRLADVQPYILKVWEREFPMLAAHRSPTGPQFYTEEELELVKRIKHLLYDEQYTIAGACKRLLAEQARAAGAAAPPAPAPDEPEEPEEPEASAAPEAPAGPAAPEPSAPPAAPRSAGDVLLSGGEEEEQPLLLAQEPAAPSKPRRPRARPAAAGPRASSAELPGAESVDPVEAPVVQRPDPRVARAIAELREILELLKRDVA